MTGTTLGSYRVLEKIGEGGMGAVYRARDERLGRDVALKILPEVFAADPDRLMRLRREAQVLAALNHPNIAAIYGFEDSTPTPALVLELVEGVTLSDRLAVGPIAVKDALTIARQVAGALAAAHEAGIVHRDLKPSNIKLRDDGVAKVLDFGIAKAVAPDGVDAAGAAASTTTARATALGVILGTVAYMAPEQARGQPVDRRADLWAFGVVLYEMLAHRRAFDGHDTPDLVASILRDTPPFDALPAETPPVVRRLIARCLEKDRAARLDSMTAARLDIDETLGGNGAETQPPLPGRARWITGLAAIALVAGGLVIGMLPGWISDPPHPRVSRLTVLPAPGTEIARDLNRHDVAISPDGSRVIYQRLNQGTPELAVRRLDRFDSLPVTAPTGLAPSGPFVSPNGQWLGYFVGNPSGTVGELVKVPIDGGTPVSITAVRGAAVRGATWAPDDTIVYATNQLGTGLFRVRASGGASEPLTKPAPGEIDHVWPSFLPDGRHLLFTVQRAGGLEASEIAILSLADLTWRVLVVGGTFPQYLSTGHILYATRGGLRAVPFDLTRLEVTGPFVQLADRVVVKESGAADFAVSQAGTLAFVSGESSTGRRLAWLDRSGTRTPEPAGHRRQYRGVTLAPEGDRAVVLIEEGGGTTLWLYEFARGTLTPLLPPGFTGATSPAWRPDGREIVFWSPSGPNGEGAGLFRVLAAGTGAPVRVTRPDDGRNQLPFVWTQDDHILGMMGTPAGYELFVLPFNPQGAPRVIVGGPGFKASPALSPDAKWLAYSSSESGRSEIFVRPFPDVDADRLAISTEGGTFPFWSHDGRELFYTAGAGTVLMAVDMRAAAGRARAGTPRRVVDGGSGIVPYVFRLARDGGRFLVIEDDQGLGPSELHVVTNWFEELGTPGTR